MLLAGHIADACYEITRDTLQTEAWLDAFYRRFSDSAAWKWAAADIRDATRNPELAVKFLLRAEEAAHDSQSWCHCAEGWHTIAKDPGRAAECMHRAERLARSFFPFTCCALGWARITPHDRETILAWIHRASEKAITPLDWLRCIWIIAGSERHEDPRTVALIESFLGQAFDRASTVGTYRNISFSASYNLGTPGFPWVLKSLDAGEARCRTTDDWGSLLSQIVVLIDHRKDADENTPASFHVAELKERFGRQLARFEARHPTAQEWLRVIRAYGNRFPVMSATDCMLKAEAAARSAQDWLDCSEGWSSMPLADAKRNACICRLRAMQASGRMRTGH